MYSVEAPTSRQAPHLPSGAFNGARLALRDFGLMLLFDSPCKLNYDKCFWFTLQNVAVLGPWAGSHCKHSVQAPSNDKHLFKLLTLGWRFSL
jgi:hypothetical protein